VQFQAISLRECLICIGENIERLEVIVAGLEFTGNRAEKSFRLLTCLYRA